MDPLLGGKPDLPLVSTVTATMLFSTVLSISCYSVISPFMPSEFQRKQVDETLVGFIFAIFSMPVIFGSPLMGSLIQRVGRRNPMIYGSYLLGISLTMFAGISFLEFKALFIALSFLARILQGIGFTLI